MNTYGHKPFGHEAINMPNMGVDGTGIGNCSPFTDLTQKLYIHCSKNYIKAKQAEKRKKIALGIKYCPGLELGLPKYRTYRIQTKV